jgi:endonuclease III
MKKNLLLAMSLANRPEQFLNVDPDDPEWRPIVDYHLMRIAGRTGMVNTSPSDEGELLRETMEARQWVAKDEHDDVREATFHAVARLIEQSGQPMHVIDHALWSARKYCPEMEDPKCDECFLKDVCEQNRERFQPVFRTTAY